MPIISVLAWKCYCANGSGISREDPLYYLQARGMSRVLRFLKANGTDLEAKFLSKQDEICQGFKNWLAHNKEPWDLLIEAPSSASYAAAFTNAVNSLILRRITLRTKGDVKAGHSRTTIDEILQGIALLSCSEREELAQAKRVLIVDDVYAAGKTSEAIERFLRQQGLPPESNITVAAPLRICGLK
jgi:predicted amidophosphoribosyltransferase